ncbi:MAG: crossover junction endodeoxyribonuclease RuvC [Patescibacteria group bacterium]|nr:crossover junction endodeoxyribonuclease RuvC [Patescibacteria group bacterium]
MRILGIDPGVATTGWGVIEDGDDSNPVGFKVLDFGVITTSAGTQLPSRLSIIYDDMIQLIKQFSPDHVSVEKLFFCKNLKTAMSVGEARGVIMLAIEKSKLEFSEFTPLQIKQGVCGYGKADKKQVQTMVAQLLGLDEIPKPDDAADALAAAICGASTISTAEKIKLSQMK